MVKELWVLLLFVEYGPSLHRLSVLMAPACLAKDSFEYLVLFGQFSIENHWILKLPSLCYPRSGELTRSQVLFAAQMKAKSFSADLEQPFQIANFEKSLISAKPQKYWWMFLAKYFALLSLVLTWYFQFLIQTRHLQTCSGLLSIRLNFRQSFKQVSPD